LIQVTRDGGKTWTNVTPKEMPEFGRVSIIDASAFDSGSAYVAVKRPLMGDMRPYVFKTRDYGRTWTTIVNGLGPLDYVHTVREDPTRAGLLYAGTQHGVYVSFNDGANWQSLSLNLPDVPVSDLIVEANDLAISTHGRGFYILDRVGPLRQMGDAMAASDVYLFKPGDAIRSAGGATIQYLLRKPAQSISVEVVDARGTVAWSAQGGSAAPAAPAAAAPGGQGRGGRGGGPAGAPVAAGLNTVTWSLQYPSAASFPGMILWGGGVGGPLAAPGTYQVRLTADGKTETRPLIVKRHPLYSATDADLQAQFDFAIQVRDKVSEANNAVIQIRKIKAAIDDRLSKSSDEALKESGGTLKKNLSTVEEQIYQVRNQSGQDPLNFPIKTNNRLASLLSMVDNGDGRPIANAPAVFKDLVAELKAETDQLSALMSKDLTAFNAMLRRLSLEPIAEK